jgi:hypothetical protein
MLFFSFLASCQPGKAKRTNFSSGTANEVVVVMAGSGDLKCNAGFKLWYERRTGVQLISNPKPYSLRCCLLTTKQPDSTSKNTNTVGYDVSRYSLWWSACPLPSYERVVNPLLRADSIAPSDGMIMRMMADRGDQLFNVDSEPQLYPDILHIPKVTSLAEVKASVCGQKNPHRNLDGDQTQKPLSESPVSYPDTTRSPSYGQLSTYKIFL